MAATISRLSDGAFRVDIDDDEHVHTTLTSSGDEVSEWLDLILFIHRRRLHRLVVGLDVEWRPTFRPGPTNPVALLQICVGRRCLVFQILRADYIPDGLSDFLTDERFTFVGVGIRADVEKLEADYGLEVGYCEDLREMAAEKLGMPLLRRTGLQNIVREVMGVHLEKPRSVRLSDWDRRDLTIEQVKYAAVDAFTSFEVGKRLINGEY